MLYFAKFIGFFAWITPWPLRVLIAKSLSRFVYFVGRFRRYTLLKNLLIAFPEKSLDERTQIVLSSLENQVLGFFEFFSLPWVRPAFVAKRVEFHGLDKVEKAHSQGKGVLLLSLHMGNGDFACAMLNFRSVPIHLISKKFKVKWLNDFWFGVREAMGTKFIDAHNARNAFQILGALKGRGSVCFILDQYMGKPFGIETSFFGKKVGTAYGLALFARKSGAPVVPVYTYRDDFGKTHIQFEDEAIFDWGHVEEEREEQLRQATQLYNDRLEKMVRSHPDQWMWIHRRWKRFK